MTHPGEMKNYQERQQTLRSHTTASVLLTEGTAELKNMYDNLLNERRCNFELA